MHVAYNIVNLSRASPKMADPEVLIIGAGPVGLTLAAELSYRKVNCTLVEKRLTTTDLPKSFNLTVRSMEHFRRLGLSEAIRSKSYPPDVPIALSGVTSVFNKREIFSKKFAAWGEVLEGKPGKEMLYFLSGCSVEIPMLCPQFALEPIIKEKVDGSPYVTSLWGWELLSFEQTEEGVTAQIQRCGGGDKQEVKTITARYMVGCDGGKSPVRKFLGVPLYGKFEIQHVLGIYFSCPEMVEPMKSITGLTLVMGDHYNSFLIAFDPSKSKYMAQIILNDSQSAKVDEILADPKRVVQKLIGRDADVEILAAYPWKAHAVTAGKYREGSVFLCGDAAHQWIPAGGLGLNTGIGEAVDLAWKLEATLRGWGGQHLLDSYFLERYPVAENTLRYITRFFGTARSDIFSSTVFKIGTNLPVIRTILGKQMGDRIVNSMQHMTKVVLAFDYSNSNIIIREPKDEVEPLPRKILQDPFAPIARPGRRLPHLELPDVPSIYDLLGESYVLLVINGEEYECESLVKEAEKRGMPLKVVPLPCVAQVVFIFQKRYYLVRPDTVIAWCSNFQPNIQEAVNILDAVTGCVPPKRNHPKLVLPEAWSPLKKIPMVFSAAVSACVAFGIHLYTDYPDYIPFFAAITLLGLLSNWPFKRYPAIVKQVSRHQASVIDEYGEPTEVLRMDRADDLSFGPKDVLIRVKAASVSPIDVSMCRGYGAGFFETLYKSAKSSVFPRSFGRDCAGEVMATGDEVKYLLPGDQVYAVVPISHQGSHAQFVTAEEDTVALKPNNADFVGAASFPWVACTVWTALVRDAGLNKDNAAGKKVLVHAGSGGNGSFAIQLLKAWGARVTSTCSTADIDFVRHLGADTVVDITKENFVETLEHDYDVVLDTIGFHRHYESPSLSVLKRYGGAIYVSLVSPRFLFQMRLGNLLGSALFSWLYCLKIAYCRILRGQGFYYSAVEPSRECLDYVRSLVEEGKIRPIIDSVFPLGEIKDAYKKVSGSNVQGKVIVKMD